MTPFRVEIHIDDEKRHSWAYYQSVEQALDDHPLTALLDRGYVTVTVWAGDLKLHGSPLRSSAELRETLLANRRALGGLG